MMGRRDMEKTVEYDVFAAAEADNYRYVQELRVETASLQEYCNRLAAENLRLLNCLTYAMQQMLPLDAERLAKMIEKREER
jgi:hypothetical protein